MKLKLLVLSVVLLFLISSFGTIALNTKHKDFDNKQDRKNIFLGELPNNSNQEGITITGDTPVSFDWRNHNNADWTTPIKNQGTCASCYAFAAIAALESCFKIKVLEDPNPSKEVDFSEQFVMSCGNYCSYEIYGCIGGKTVDALDFIKYYGAISEDCFSYTTSDGNCDDKCENWRDKRVRIGNYAKLSKDTEAIKNALIQYGPLTTVMTVYEDFYHFECNENIPHYPNQEEWPDDIYYHKYGIMVTPTYKNHEVVIVGYNDDPGYWICKNSWGEGWGIKNPYDPNNEGGWFKIKYRDSEINDDTYFIDKIDLPESKLYLSSEEISLGKVDEDSIVSFSFTVENTGEQDSLLDWGILGPYPMDIGHAWSFKDEEGNRFINGMDGTLIPANEDKLEIGESFEVFVSFNTKSEKGKHFEGTLKLINRENGDCLGENKESLDINYFTKQGKSRCRYDNLLDIIQNKFPFLLNFLYE